jgi:D-3-phosphoglycerate dehydrogenase
MVSLVLAFRFSDDIGAGVVRKNIIPVTNQHLMRESVCGHLNCSMSYMDIEIGIEGRWRVFVTRELPQKALDYLGERCDLEVNPENRALTKEEIIDGIRGKDGLLCHITDKIDEEVINSATDLKMIANCAVGFDNVDVEAATRRDLPVSNTPGVLTDTTAELAWALLLSTARRVAEGDRFTRAGKYRGWDPMLLHGLDLKGKTLGVLGAGRIGTAFALKSRGFDMKVIYTERRANEVLDRELGAEKLEMDELLERADFISIHLPLTPETHHIIGERELKLMRRNAILVNTSRGPIIDEKALAKALKKGWIGGAGLDVYENEPEVEPGLLKLDNVVLLPHLGSATEETRTKMAMMAAENLIAGLEGKIPPNCVNPELFGRER